MPFLVLWLCAALLYGAMWAVDFGPGGPPPWVLWSRANEALLSFAEVVVAVLGVVITVVAIIVELASNRYTPRISEQFVADPVNILVMGYFVVTSVVVIWVDLSLHAIDHPYAMATGCAFLMTTSLLAILPYFAYVFDFLSPTRVIQRIQLQGTDHLHRLAAGKDTVEEARAGVIRAIEQLGDVALNSVDKKDKPLTLSTLAALEQLADDALRAKGRLPGAWFDSAPLVRMDQDFVALHPDLVRALTDRRTWVEMKILRQYQAVFGEAVNRLRDVNHLIGIHTRRVATVAMDTRDAHALQLSVRFLNTYMRNAINAKDVRSAYNLLNEYRMVAERAVDRGQHELAVELAGYIKFYGQLAFGSNLAFLLETAAYDLCMLLEHAHAARSEVRDRLLAVFLDVDREPEGGKSQEASLRGVRKAQIKLATFFLAEGDQPPARRIFEDMRAEKPERLRSIRAELERVEEAEYWEVSDRGINFEWLPPERRRQLDTFFGWFEADRPAG